MHFYARYLLVALLGGLAVWYGTPELQARRSVMPAVLERILPSALQEGADAAEAPVADTGGAHRARPDAGSAVPTASAVTEGAGPKPAQHPPSAPRPTPPRRPPDQRPAPSPRGWGILAEAARAYDSGGRPTDRHPGGTVLEILSEHDSSNGRLLRCRALVRQHWTEELFFAEEAVVRFEGGYADAPPAERDQLVEYFRLKDRVAARGAELQEQAVRANPHFNAYQSAARSMMEHQERSADLAARRDAATGMERARIEVELRRLNARRAEVLQRFKAVDEPYRRWRADNGDDGGAIASDPRILEWQQRIEELEPAVRRMVSGL